jgi:DNA-binding transcriptional LysR family regulator
VSKEETMENLLDRLGDLFIFVKVVDLKSFSEVARVTGATKSSVSKQVRRLEDALGTRLLNRSTRHLALTETGRSVYQHALRIAEQTAALRSSVEGLQDKPQGQLRVTTSVAFGNMHLTGVVVAFLRTFPDISVTLTLSDRYVDVVEEGFDIAIRLTSKPLESFVARRLSSLNYLLCATPAYLEAHAPVRTLDDLAAHHCLANSGNAGATWRFVRDGLGTDLKLDGRFSVNSSESLRRAVLDDMGIALLPDFAIAADLAAGRVRAVLPEYTVEGSFGNSIYAIFPQNKYMAPKLRVFVDFLLASFGQAAAARESVAEGEAS